MGACELTHQARMAIDIALARVQHHAYCDVLTELGCEVVNLPADRALPDCVFVEDVAIVLDDVAIVTRPGAASRRPEAAAVAEALLPYRRVTHILEPGTMDGGDVLRIGRRIFVGRSARSNASGIGQLQTIAGPYGYTVTAVPVRRCLHLKSAVTEVAPGAVLLNPAWVDPRAFCAVSVIEVDPSEPGAANGLLVGGGLIYPASFPKTRRRLETAGIAVTTVDVSELQKAEGAVTCCSLIIRVEEGR